MRTSTFLEDPGSFNILVRDRPWSRYWGSPGPGRYPGPGKNANFTGILDKSFIKIMGKINSTNRLYTV